MLSPLAQKAKLGFKLLLVERLNENLKQNRNNEGGIIIIVHARNEKDAAMYSKR